MKIAITAKGKNLASEVDQRFGRAAHFILFDTQSGAFTVVDNQQNVNALQGAGIQAAKTVVDNGAEVLITGHCGPKAFRSLSAAGVKVYIGQSGTVEEILAKFRSGEIAPTEEPDVESHWV